MCLAQGLDGGDGGGIAGDDEGAAALGYQVGTEGQYSGADEGFRLVAVGHLGGVGEVEQIGLRQGAGDGREYRQPTQTRVEESDHGGGGLPAAGTGMLISP